MNRHLKRKENQGHILKAYDLAIANMQKAIDLAPDEEGFKKNLEKMQAEAESKKQSTMQ